MYCNAQTIGVIISIIMLKLYILPDSGDELYTATRNDASFLINVIYNALGFIILLVMNSFLRPRNCE